LSTGQVIHSLVPLHEQTKNGRSFQKPTNISEERFQHLVESLPQRIKAVLKAKGGPTFY
uniref:Uncharacterized protein n=1 Tax=Pygocentrus nattereri TaxID=42514 RepID=A0AAR2JPA9_PYGNA